jgi:hypothetical protein
MKVIWLRRAVVVLVLLYPVKIPAVVYDLIRHRRLGGRGDRRLFVSVVNRLTGPS